MYLSWPITEINYKHVLGAGFFRAQDTSALSTSASGVRPQRACSLIYNCPEGSKLVNDLQNTEIKYQGIFAILNYLYAITKKKKNGQGFPGGSFIICCSKKKKKESAAQCRRYRFNPWVVKMPWRREWQPTPVFLPGKSYGQRSLAGYIVHGVTKDLDTT